MDIKKLATLTAAEMDDIYLRNVPAIILEQYATRLIERLAARVPDGCVVVHRKVTEDGRCVLATPGNYRTYQEHWGALIEAVEVKP